MEEKAWVLSEVWGWCWCPRVYNPKIWHLDYYSAHFHHFLQHMLNPLSILLQYRGMSSFLFIPPSIPFSERQLVNHTPHTFSWSSDYWECWEEVVSFSIHLALPLSAPCYVVTVYGRTGALLNLIRAVEWQLRGQMACRGH